MPSTRTRTNEGVATADTLLDAAQTLFAERGFDGTSVRAITEAAGANLAAVTYHFGSKESLLEAVLERLLIPVGQEIRDAFQGPGAPLERIHGVVAALLLYMGRNPDHPRLMLQQLTAGLKPDLVVQRSIKGNLTMLRSLVEEGQRNGTIRPGDATLMAVSLISQPVHMAVVVRPVQQTMGIPGSQEDLLERMATHAADFAVRGLEVRREGER